MTIPTIARTTVWIGAAVLLVGTAALLALGSLGEPSPFTLIQSLVQRAPVLAFTVGPVVLAVAAVVQADRRWLIGAIVLAVLSVPATFIGGLVAGLLWIFALMRFPPSPRPVSAVWSGLVPLLAVVAALVPFVHNDPLCWTFTTDGDGERTYTPDSVDGRFPSGFGAPSMFIEGLSSTGAAEVQEDGEPVGRGDERGQQCVSNHVTPLQGGISVGLVAVCAGLALRPPGRTGDGDDARPGASASV